MAGDSATSQAPTLQFPLALLAYGASVNERLNAAIHHAIVVTGRHRAGVLTVAQIEAEIKSHRGEWPKDSKKVSRADAGAMMLGAVFSRVHLGSFSGTLKDYRKAVEFLESWQAMGRKSPLVRIGVTITFEARDGDARSYGRFAALCAVNAVIGSKPYTVVTRNRIRAGMLGYGSGGMLFDETGGLTPEGSKLLAERADQAQPITTDQTRTLLDKLVASELLSRFNPRRGSVTYYSKSLSPVSIAEALLKKVDRTADNPKLAEARELLRQARHKAETPLLCGDGNGKAPHNGESPHNRESPTQAPACPHPSPTQAPHNAASLCSPVMQPCNAASSCTEERAAAPSIEKTPQPAGPVADYIGKLKQAVESQPAYTPHGRSRRASQ